MACVVVGHRRTRQYGLYVSDTQSQADDHVSNVGAMLESSEVAALDPELSERRIGKYGSSKAWRRNRLWTQAGLIIDALGLDTAARGAKLEEQRPDFIVLDDIDNESDTVTTTEKKIRIITRRLIPAGSSDVIVIAIQNLVHPDGVFARLASDDPPFISDRILSGPHPALRKCQISEVKDRKEGKYVITNGEPIWDGQDVVACQRLLDKMGPSAFRAECLHEVESDRPGTLVFPTFSVQNNVTTGHPVPWSDCIFRAVGIDPGGGHPTAVIPIGVYRRKDSDELFFHQFGEFYSRQNATLERIVQYLAAIDGVAKIDAVWIDTAGGEVLMNSIAAYGFATYPAIKDRSLIASVMRPLIEQQRLTIHQSAKESIAEFWGYRWKQITDPIDGSKFDTDTPGENHGDGQDGRRYAVVGAKRAIERSIGSRGPAQVRVRI